MHILCTDAITFIGCVSQQQLKLCTSLQRKSFLFAQTRPAFTWVPPSCSAAASLSSPASWLQQSHADLCQSSKPQSQHSYSVSRSHSRQCYRRPLQRLFELIGKVVAQTFLILSLLFGRAAFRRGCALNGSALLRRNNCTIV